MYPVALLEIIENSVVPLAFPPVKPLIVPFVVTSLGATKKEVSPIISCFTVKSNGPGPAYHD